jgi:hypothetical protein
VSSSAYTHRPCHDGSSGWLLARQQQQTHTRRQCSRHAGCRRSHTGKKGQGVATQVGRGQQSVQHAVIAHPELPYPGPGRHPQATCCCSVLCVKQVLDKCVSCVMYYIVREAPGPRNPSSFSQCSCLPSLKPGQLPTPSFQTPDSIQFLVVYTQGGRPHAASTHHPGPSSRGLTEPQEQQQWAR